jgi:hypothetical protein
MPSLLYHVIHVPAQIPAEFLRLVEESKDLARNVLASRLLVVHDTSRGRKDDVAELTRRQQLDNPLLKLNQADVEARADDASLVQAAVQLDDNLAVKN